CALAVGACGDDNSSGGGKEDGAKAKDGGGKQAVGGGATKIELSADPGGALKFDKRSLTAKPGKVTIAFDNPAQVPHAVEVEGGGVEEETDTTTEGSAELTVDLKAGEYEFYCPVGNHRQAGMEGTLTVR
ncbi:MAG TPA: plastocyanin/azurin family copper-binding protein, partial [Rhodospirillales bacterium]|nr:plastocyanin/azurin family copper-binding protein [Rhodospirillales bacterium]